MVLVHMGLLKLERRQMPTSPTITEVRPRAWKQRKEQILTAGKVGGGFTQRWEQSGAGMSSFHGQKQHEHGPAPACGASVCPGAESSVAGSASLPAPTRRLSDLGLISRPRPRDQDRDKAWLCVQGRAGVWKDREHSLSSICLLLTSTGFKKHLD